MLLRRKGMNLELVVAGNLLDAGAHARHGTQLVVRVPCVDRADEDAPPITS